MFESQVDTTKLFKAMKQLSVVLDKDIDEVVEHQSKLMVGQLVGQTPPGGPKGTTGNNGNITSSAKKYGEAAIKADIASLFPTTRKPEKIIDGMIAGDHRWDTKLGKRRLKQKALTLSDMKRIHQKSRSPRTGRVRKGKSSEYMAISRASIKNQYQKELIKNVGMLAAGWNRAARELKTSKGAIPAWVKRHQDKPGGVSFRNTKSGLTINLYNNMSYFPRDIDRRLQRVVKWRTHAILKQLDYVLTSQINRKVKRYLG